MRAEKKTVRVAVAAAAAALLLAAAWGAKRAWWSGKAAAPRQARASRGDLEVHFKEAGELQAKVDIQVRPPVDGQVEHVLVQEGDPVKRGQILAVIQPGKTEAEQKLYVAAPIRSPIDGIVLYLNTNDGDVTTAGKDDFIHVADLRTLIVRLEIGEADILKLKVGQAAAVTVDALPGRTFSGKIYFISPGAIEPPKNDQQPQPQMSSGPKKFVVKVQLDKTDPRLKPGMTARADMLLDKHSGVVKIPLEALFEDMGKSSVYVQGPSGVVQREVRTGLRNDEDVEILAGLRENETVLLEKPAGQVPFVALDAVAKTP